jgi:beta-mannanase
MHSPSLRPAVLALALCAPLLLAGCSSILPRIDRHGSLALDSGRPMAGAWLGEWPTADNRAIERFERDAGIRLDLVDVYLDWFTPVANVTHTLETIGEHGALPILTWEAQTITTRDILDGDRVLPLRDGRRLAIDDYVAEFAAGVCDAAILNHQPILLRIMHEMNGDWFAWGIAYQAGDGSRPNTEDTYKRAWAKLHEAFSGRCGDNVRFVWAINHASVGPGTSFMGTYPGDDYVDLVGIDGYNWGTRAPWGWQDFDALFQPGLCTLERETSKPILIAEVGSSEAGGDKAAWIQDMLRNVAERERVQGFVWLNHEKHEVQVGGTMDWNVDSSPEALDAFSDGVGDLLRKGKQANPEAPACP